MLNAGIAKYLIYKIIFLFRKSKNVRNPLNGRFKIIIQNESIQGNINNLINFVNDNYSINDISVKILHNMVKWEKYYCDLSPKGRKLFEYQHMEMIIKSDLSYPIILTSNSNGEITNIIDGLHRIKKAYMLNKTIIKSYIIPETDLLNHGGVL